MDIPVCYNMTKITKIYNFAMSGKLDNVKDELINPKTMGKVA